jgi:hypothetical protein
MVRKIINRFWSSALILICVMLLPSTAYSAEGCDGSDNSAAGGGDNPPSEPTGATGGSGGSGFSESSDTNSVARDHNTPSEPSSSETTSSESCGATVSESSEAQASGVTLTLLSKIGSSRAKGGSGSRAKGGRGSGGKEGDKKSKKKASGGAAGADSADNAMLDGSRFSLFGFADYSTSDRHASFLGGGYEQEANSLTLGFDYRLDDSTFFGAFVNGSDGDTELDAGNGGSDVSSTTVGIHGAKYWGNTFVAGLVAYGTLDIASNRSTSSDGFRASTDGDFWSGSLSIGFEENFGGWRITPQAGVLLLSGDIDGFQERSASGTGVVRSINSQDIASEILTLTLQADHPVLLNWGVLLPSLRVDLITDGGDGSKINGQNLDDSNKNVISSFADQAEDPDSSNVSVSAGTSALFRDGLVVYAVYERLFYHEYLNKYTATVGFRYELP